MENYEHIYYLDCPHFTVGRVDQWGEQGYLLFEGKILFQGTPEELAENKIVREKYLSNSFVLRRKDFQLNREIRE